jgi:hypothetical protein
MKMLRHRDTGEVMPMNADVARNENMVSIEVPDPKTMITFIRGVAYIEEKDIFGEVEAAPAPPKKRARKKTAAAEEPDALGSIDMSEEAATDAA